jgi:chitodextrinase
MLRREPITLCQFLIVILTLMISLFAEVSPAAVETSITTDVIGAAGGQAQSASYKVHDTVGQGPVGPAATGTIVVLQDGFWSALGAGGVAGDITPPLAVTGFVVLPLDTAASLEWANPSDADFAGTLIRYSTVDFPLTISEGTPIENGKGGIFLSDPGSEDEFSHDGLINGTRYYYTAFAFDSSGNYAEGVSDSTTPYDGVPPGQVTVGTPQAGDGFITLRWSNPSDPDFEHTLIKYSTTGYPSDHTEGIAVENGADGMFPNAQAAADSFTHTDLSNGTRYYYSLFAADEVHNYSVPATADGIPQDTEPPLAVVSFEAVARDDGSVKLRWTNPDDDDFVGSMVRYSTAAYPTSEAEGAAVPNGTDGRFEAAPAAVDSFIHAGLTIGSTYYYAAFAYDDVPNYAGAVTASAAPYDMVPPLLSVSVFQNPYITNHLDVYLVASEALRDTSVHCDIAGDGVSMVLMDSDENVWKSDYEIYTTGMLSIHAQARDIALNWGDISRTFSSSLILASNVGTAISVDGHCTVTLPAGAVKDDAYVLIFDERCEHAETGKVYYVSPSGLDIDDYVEISVAYGDVVREPRHLCVARLDETGMAPLDSYVDAEAGRIIAYTDRLGAYGILWRADIETPAYGEGDFLVQQNVPNPFAGSTSAAFEVPRSGQIHAEVISIDGRLIRNLYDGNVIPGRHAVQWDGRDADGNKVACGVYFYRITYEGRTITKKMVHLR